MFHHGSSFNDSDPKLKKLFIRQKKKKRKINMGILIMELDLIEDHASHFLVVDFVKMY